MGIGIRPARSARDLDATRELFREYADWLGINRSLQGFEAELARLPGKYVASEGELFLAEREDGRPTGCVGLTLNLPDQNLCGFGLVPVDETQRLSPALGDANRRYLAWNEDTKR